MFVRDGSVGNGAARMGNARWRRLTEERAGGAKSVFHFDASLKGLRAYLVEGGDLLVLMPTSERPKLMHVRRIFLCLAATFLWVTYDPGMASGQSSELTEAFTSYNTLYQQGRYSEAEPYAKEALRLGTEEFGPNDPTTADLLNNLASLYQAQGRYAEAEPLNQRALAINEKALGPEHPNVATSLNDLARLYRAQGKYAAAEPLYKRALAIYEKALGPDHPHVATGTNNLALLYQVQGRYAEAEPLYKRALRSERIE